MLLVEHKCVGEDLDDVKSQSLRSIWALATAGRHDEIPRYVMLSDFARISLLDLEPEDPIREPFVAVTESSFRSAIFTAISTILPLSSETSNTTLRPSPDQP